MRVVTYRLSPDWEVIASGDWRALGLGDALEAIHDVRELADGSAVAQMTVGADPDRLRAWGEHCDGILDLQVVGEAEESLVQCHFWPTEPLGALLECHRTRPVVLDFPIEVVDPAEPTLRIVATGHIDELKGLIDATRALGTVTIEEIGSFDRRRGRLFATLTERQQQVLRTALDRGYYDVPREVTYEDIARELDCSASTVGQHLRRIESSVLSAITPGDGGEELQEPPVH